MSRAGLDRTGDDGSTSVQSMTNTDDNDRGATFLLAIWVPDADPDQDPDVTADEFVYMLNQQRMKAGGIDHFKPVEVSAIPAPQWVTPETMARLRGDSDVLARVFEAETWDDIKAIQREHAR